MKEKEEDLISFNRKPTTVTIVNAAQDLQASR